MYIPTPILAVFQRNCCSQSDKMLRVPRLLLRITYHGMVTKKQQAKEKHHDMNKTFNNCLYLRCKIKSPYYYFYMVPQYDYNPVQEESCWSFQSIRWSKPSAFQNYDRLNCLSPLDRCNFFLHFFQLLRKHTSFSVTIFSVCSPVVSVKSNMLFLSDLGTGSSSFFRTLQNLWVWGFRTIF